MVLELDSLFIDILSFRKGKIGTYSNSHTTAKNSISPMEYFFSVSFKYLLPNAIGLVFTSFFAIVLFRVRLS